MKRCPECRRDYYDDSLLYCLDDGSSLLEGPGSGNESATAILAARHSIAGTIEPTTQQSKRGPTLWLLSALGLAAVLAGALGFYWWQSSRSQAPRSIRLEKVTTDGKTTTAAISPDGRYAVYNIDSGGAQSLWTRQIATASPVQIIAPAEGVEYRSIRFSPDGNFVTFLKRDLSDRVFSVFQVPVLGGPEKKLINNVDGGVTYSPDGKSVTFLRGNFPAMGDSSVMIANADGSNERVLTKRTRPETFPWWPIGNAAWSPDGKTIATVIGGPASGSGPMEVAGVNVADGTVSPITNHAWYEIFQVAWLPDNTGLIIIGAEKATDFYTQQIFYISYPGGEKRRISTDFNMYLALSLTADGETMAAIQNNRVANIWMVPNGDASRAEQIRAGGANHEGTDGLAMAPDGRVVFYSKASGADDFWIMNSDGSGVRQITRDAAANYDLKITPDGRYVVFTSERAGQPNIWRMDIDGANAKQLSFGRSEYGSTITPDSKWVYYDSTSSGAPAIWRVSIDGGEPRQVISRYTENPEVSPDGKLIACHFRENIGAPWRVATFNIDGGEPIKILDVHVPPGEDFRWTPDGRSIAYAVTTKGVANVWSYPIDGGAAKQLTNFKNDQMFNFKWSPDGRNMVMARGTVTSDVVLIKDFR